MESGSDSGSEAPSSILLLMVNEEGNNETVHHFSSSESDSSEPESESSPSSTSDSGDRPFNEEDTYDCEEETGRATSYVEKQAGVGWDGSVIRDSGAFILATQTQKKTKFGSWETATTSCPNPTASLVRWRQRIGLLAQLPWEDCSSGTSTMLGNSWPSCRSQSDCGRISRSSWSTKSIRTMHTLAWALDLFHFTCSTSTCWVIALLFVSFQKQSWMWTSYRDLESRLVIFRPPRPHATHFDACEKNPEL